jgi:FAD-dependent oxidoreductase domain-containing protein 1
MRHGYDVVIVGGAIIGSSIAYFLSVNPRFKRRVLVVERDPTYQSSSSAKSASSIRQQFTTAINIEISQFGVEFLKNCEQYLGAPGRTTGVEFTERGYVLLTDPQGLAALKEKVRFQRDHGVNVVLFDNAGLEERYPWLNTEGLAGGATTLSGEGWFDAYILLQAFRRKAIENGVEYAAEDVTSVHIDSTGHASSVHLSKRGEISCGALINAAGAWSGTLAKEQLGVTIPVSPRKRVVFVVDNGQSLINGTTVVDPNGLTFRPEGRQYIVHFPPRPEDDREGFDLTIDFEEFEARVWEPLALRVPAFEQARVTSAWAGYYDFNAFDHNALLGILPERPNVVFANGFSGHGVMQAPAVGRGIAELIAHGRYTSLDLSPLWVGRVAAGKPLEEKNVL